MSRRPLPISPPGATGQTTPSRKRARTATLTVLALITGVLSVGVTTLGASAPASAAPGTPGTAGDPLTVFSEDFQNVAGATPIERLTAYTGTGGETYTADPAWLTRCNGWIAAAEQSTTAAAQIEDCVVSAGSGPRFWNQSQQLAQALGMFDGQTADEALSNYAQTAFTSADPGAGKVEFETVDNIPFVASNRFIAFSVDVAAINCSVAAPLLQFSLLNDAGAVTPAGSQVNACTSTQSVTVPRLGAASQTSIKVGSYRSNEAILFSGASIGVRMVNNQATGSGNDHTIDNLQILDVTPQLDTSFSPTLVETNGTSTLTYTVTNTSELGAKNGWSFDNTLPAGLTIASTPAVGGTCEATTVATAGSDSITVGAGSLALDQTSCTITVNVTSDTAAAYTNAPSDITTAGLNAPEASTVTFTDPAYTVSTTASTATPKLGDTVTYTVTVKNTGPWAYNDTAPAPFTAASFTGDLTDVLDDATYNNDVTGGATISQNSLAWTGSLAVGETKTFTYSVTVKNPNAGDHTLTSAVVPNAEANGTCDAAVGCSTTAVAIAAVPAVDTATPVPAVSPAVDTSAPVAVVTPANTLAVTGTFGTTVLLGGGLMALLAGLALLIARRRHTVQ